MRISLITLAFFLHASSAFCQLEYSNWVLRDYTQIDFRHNPPVVTNKMISLLSNDDIASISDVSGNLLFYSEGEIIYNRNDQIIARIPYRSLIYTVLSVPHPLGDNKYYYFIITIGNDNDYRHKLHCYTLDFNQNNGLGTLSDELFIDKLPRFVPLKLTMAIAKHSDNINYWILTSTNDMLYAYHIANDAVVNSVSSSFVFLDKEKVLNMKISPDMSSVYLFTTKNIYVSDFNNNSGQFANFRKILTFPSSHQKALNEFSPDGHFLYCIIKRSSSSYRISRFNTESNSDEASFKNSEEVVGVLELENTERLQDIQLAINGKIYISIFSNMLGAIENPNETIPVCYFNKNALNVNSNTRELPHFRYYTASFGYQASCVANDVQFKYRGIIPVSSQWSFGDTQTSTELNPTHTYASAGKYTVQLVVTYSDNKTQTITKEILVNGSLNIPVIKYD